MQPTTIHISFDGKTRSVRENRILASGGFKGGGKTYQTYKILQSYVLPTDGSIPRKALIFDTNMEYTNGSVIKSGFSFPIKTIKAEDLQLFNRHPKVECVRILPINKDGTLMSIPQKKETAWNIIQTFRGGILVLDDINSYVLNVTHEDEFVGAIMNNAHRNADIILNFQSINMINPVLIRNMNFVRLHYQSDQPQSGKFLEKWELYMIAWLIVKHEFNKGGMGEKFCVNIDNLRFKIMGEFSKLDFVRACYHYLNEFMPSAIKRQQTKMKLIGADKDNSAAIAEAVKRLFMYYGNDN